MKHAAVVIRRQIRAYGIGLCTEINGDVEIDKTVHPLYTPREFSPR
ncbi:hypothetical protein PMI38_00846 [Pseudomonas sp. GM84]|nr:hypothetical protein PMI38_00846 [Pseudomonas sp. GM84]